MNALFAATELYPKDPVIGLTESFREDLRPHKINLSGGAYCNDRGEVSLMRAVHRVEQERARIQPFRNYLPIEGSPAFNCAAQALIFGVEQDSGTPNRIVTIQALGGTGALRLAAEYLKTLYSHSAVYISDPSWDNHRQIFDSCGFSVERYPYYSTATKTVDFSAMTKCLQSLPAYTIIILHVCCHNPTGADLTQQQWLQIINIVKEQRLIAILDMAYQGFGQGVTHDTLPLQWFAQANLSFIATVSFSKSFSLYGERVGALSVVTENEDQAIRVQSSLKRLIRTNYSNPPTHGGALVQTILRQSDLYQSWVGELEEMRAYVQQMRALLVDKLNQLCSANHFAHLLKQNGIFGYTGLSPEQVARLRSEYAIYAVNSGRICIAALNTQNIDAVAAAIAAV